MFENRIKWVEHKGKRILETDFSNLDTEQIRVMLDDVTAVFEKEPLKSVRVVSGYEGIHFSVNTLNLFNKVTPHHQKYMLAGAIYGVRGLVKVMYDAFAKFSKMEIKVFPSLEEAKDWLAEK